VRAERRARSRTAGPHDRGSRLASVLVVHRTLLVAQVLAGRLSAELFLDAVVATSDPRRATGPRAQEARSRWDLVVMDSSLAGAIGAGAGSPRTRGSHWPRLLLVGNELDDPLAALTFGAQGWLPFDVGTDTLVEAVRAVLDGHVWLPPGRYPDVVQRLLLALDGHSRLSVLTERQLQVLQALVNGQTTQDTAQTLFMSPNTVRTHRARLFSKLGVHHALEAVVLAREAGLSPE
jgi:DNA-binding NarL/FixJ family response regulator